MTVGLWKTHTGQRSRRMGGVGACAVDGGRSTHVKLLQRLLPLPPPLPPPPPSLPTLLPLQGRGTKGGLEGGTRAPSRTRTAARTPYDLRTHMTTRAPNAKAPPRVGECCSVPFQTAPSRSDFSNPSTITMVCTSFTTIALCDAKVKDNMKSVCMMTQMTRQTIIGLDVTVVRRADAGCTGLGSGVRPRHALIVITMMHIDQHTFARITLRSKGHTHARSMLTMGSNGGLLTEGSRGPANKALIEGERQGAHRGATHRG